MGRQLTPGASHPPVRSTMPNDGFVADVARRSGVARSGPTLTVGAGITDRVESGRYRAAPASRRASYCAAVIGYRCSPRTALWRTRCRPSNPRDIGWRQFGHRVRGGGEREERRFEDGPALLRPRISPTHYPRAQIHAHFVRLSPCGVSDSGWLRPATSAWALRDVDTTTARPCVGRRSEAPPRRHDAHHDPRSCGQSDPPDPPGTAPVTWGIGPALNRSSLCDVSCLAAERRLVTSGDLDATRVASKGERASVCAERCRIRRTCGSKQSIAAGFGVAIQPAPLSTSRSRC